MYYKASLDKVSIGVSAGIALLFVIITVMLFVMPAPPDASFIRYLGVFFFIPLYFLVWLYHPTGYDLTPDEIILLRATGNVHLLRSEITELRRVEKDELRGTIRTFGVGGLFGYYGRFYNSKLGKMTWFMTNTNNAVLIRMKSGKVYLLSPDDREAFLSSSRN